jgi:hypothetical protein
MGIRGELYSARFASEGRTYFFNVKQNRNGDVFLSIVESKQGEGETFDRRSIVVFADQLDGFLKSFENVLKFVEKTGTKVSPDPTAYNRSDNDDRDSGMPRRKPESTYRRSDSAPRRSDDSSRKPDYAPRRSDDSSRKPDYAPRRSDDSSRKSDYPPRRSEGFSRKREDEAPRRRESFRTTHEPKTERDRPPAAGEDKPVRRIVVRKPKAQDRKD